MSLANEMRRFVATENEPVEFSQGSYRLRLMPGMGSIHDVAFSIWEDRGAQWEPIVAGWARDGGLIVSTWSPPGSPANAESLARFVMAGKRVSPSGAPQHCQDSTGHQAYRGYLAAP